MLGLWNLTKIFILDAYDSGNMITYEEVDVDEIELSGRRRSNRKKQSFLPLFYFLLFSLSIIAFVAYYVWNYIQTQPINTSEASYSVVTTTTSDSTTEVTSNNQSILKQVLLKHLQ